MLRDGSFVERSTDGARQFHRIVVGPEMDEEHTRLLVEHVAMDRGHLDIPGSQRANNFACCQPLAEIMSWSPENGNGPARKNREHLGLDVRSGSNREELTASKCLPGYP
jgi:hypothetical protein